jgi:hypothetical protein
MSTYPLHQSDALCRNSTPKFEHDATTIQQFELGYHDCKMDVLERGLHDGLVRDSAPSEKRGASGVDKLTSSYTDDDEKLMIKTLEIFKDYLIDEA